MKYLKNAFCFFICCSISLSVVAMDTGCEIRKDYQCLPHCADCNGICEFFQPFECGHTFHRECFLKLFRSFSDLRECPVCNSLLKPTYKVNVVRFETDKHGSRCWVPNFVPRTTYVPQEQAQEETIVLPTGFTACTASSVAKDDGETGPDADEKADDERSEAGEDGGDESE